MFHSATDETQIQEDPDWIVAAPCYSNIAYPCYIRVNPWLESVQ